MELNDALKQALADPPPLSEQRHRILRPLSDQELFACFRRVRLDRVDHIRAKHAMNANPPSSHPVKAWEFVLEAQTDREFRFLFHHSISMVLDEYWSHVTEGAPRADRVAGGLSHSPGSAG